MDRKLLVALAVVWIILDAWVGGAWLMGEEGEPAGALWQNCERGAQC